MSLNYMILIDDARLFLAPPPSPHNHQSWPTLTEIVHCLPENWELAVYEDVIYLFPKKISDEFKKFLQRTITEKHNKKAWSLRRVFEKGARVVN